MAELADMEPMSTEGNHTPLAPSSSTQPHSDADEAKIERNLYMHAIDCRPWEKVVAFYSACLQTGVKHTNATPSTPPAAATAGTANTITAAAPEPPIPLPDFMLGDTDAQLALLYADRNTFTHNKRSIACAAVTGGTGTGAGRELRSVIQQLGQEQEVQVQAGAEAGAVI